MNFVSNWQFVDAASTRPERESEMKVPPSPSASKNLKDEHSDDWIAPFDMTMDRTSVFIPEYMDRLLAMVAAKQGVGKAKFMRNAILRELCRYLEEAEKINEGKYTGVRPKADQPLYVGTDTEIDEKWVRALYMKFAGLDEKFPDPVQLHYKRR